MRETNVQSCELVDALVADRPLISSRYVVFCCMVMLFVFSSLPSIAQGTVESPVNVENLKQPRAFPEGEPKVHISLRPFHAEPSTDSPLIAAMQQGHLAEVDQLIDSHANLNFRDSLGNTPLVQAISHGLIYTAKRMVGAGADPNFSDTSGISPLMYAASYCNQDLVPFLLSRGALVNAADSFRYTALMNAAASCLDGKLVAVLLKAGADVGASGDDGETALTLAAWNGDESAVKRLVRAGANLNARNSRGWTALTIARDKDVERKKAHDRIYAFLRGLESHTPPNER